MQLKLRYYQQEAIDAVYRHLRERDDNPCVVLPTGCHAAGHPILMFDGTVKPVENIRVGDQVMGPDSRPRNVKALCRGEDDLFQIIPRKGEPFTVNGDHILSLVCTTEGKPYPCCKIGGEIDNITVREYLGKSEYWRHLRKLYRVPVDYAIPRDLPIPPYILGLLLGDGSIKNTVQLTTADDEIANAWRDYADLVDCKIVPTNRSDRCPTYTLRRSAGKYNQVLNSLEALGLMGCGSGQKFIPHQYLTASREQRLQLLAGLMDSDGHLHRTSFDYITKSKDLASDTVVLARSLGFAAYCKEKYCCCQTGAGGWYYRIRISGNGQEIPCRLPRKQSPPRIQKKSVLREGFQVKSCGQGSYYGFTLDGDHLYVDGHFVVHHNSGKTALISTICQDAVTKWNGRVLILAHVKELLEQTAGTIRQIAPDLDVGVYSAGLKSRDTAQSVIVAGIQSVYQRACELDRFDLVIVDECHLLKPESEGRYYTFLKDAKVVNPNLRLIGLTATPYRMKSGMLCGPDNLLNGVCYEMGVKELITKGFLCPLRTKAGRMKVDTSKLHVRAGEFIGSEVEELMDTDELVGAACRELVEMTKDRRSVLVFAASVAHAQHVKAALERMTGEECGLVTGDTPSSERDHLIARFKDQEIAANLFGDTYPPLKYLVNVNVLTTGFDAPNVDSIVLLRPTASPGLFYQMVGRSFRLHPGKIDALILDYAGNILRHGPVDAITIRDRSASNGGEAPAKECPECRAVIHAAYSTCPDCGFEFPPPENSKHEASASGEGILTGEVIDTEYDVEDVYYSVHTKRGADDDAPKTMRVTYRVGLNDYQSEWVCPEHSGWARQKFEDWWRARSNDSLPTTAQKAVDIAEAGGVAATREITVRKVTGDPFDRIIDYRLGEKPEPVPLEVAMGLDPDSIPF